MGGKGRPYGLGEPYEEKEMKKMGILARIAPKWAYERQMYKNALTEVRSYDAGKYDRLNRNWNAVNESGEMTDRYYRDTVRARARDLERNSDIMNAQIYPFINNVVGKGFTLEAKTEDEELNDKIERLWVKWCKKENCDVTGSQSLREMARMAVRRKRVDGGILFIKCSTPGGLLPFKLQALEVDELCETHFEPKEKGMRVVGGVEYDRYNRATGYWIKEYDINGYETNAARYVKAEDVIFYFSKTRPSQIREMPEMAAEIGRIKELNGYIEAASVKERIAACLSVFIKKAYPQNPLGNPSKELKDYSEVELTPGLITDLNQGDEIQVVNPGNGATDGAGFIRTMNRLISAGQGISYESAARDLTQTNYSSARQAAIEDEETFVPEQEKLKEEFLDVVYESFLKSAVLSGLLDIPDFFGNTDYYTRHDWNRKPKKWIDPYKEARASQTALDAGLKTPVEIWAEGGRDYKAVLDEMKKVQDYAEEIGLNTDLPYIKGGDTNGKQEEE